MVILKLKKVLDSLINWTIVNYLNETDKTETWLYQVFNPIQEGAANFKAYEQIVSILIRTKSNPRKLETRLMFDPTRADMPTIHVHMPQENPVGGNFLNMGADSTDNVGVGEDMFSDNYKKEFIAGYDIIVTSNNQTEVLMLYEFLKRIFVAGADTILNSFDTFNYSGKELLYDSTLMPNVFYRAFSVELSDIVKVPSIISKQTGASSIDYTGYFVGHETEDETTT